MELTFVIDTNVFIGSPDVLNELKDATVIIPIAVIEELDNLKELDNSTSASARHAIRTIEKLRWTNKLSRGVYLEEQNLKVVVDTNCMEHKSVYDNRILGVAIHHEGSILLTNDLSLRIKADSYDVESMGYPFDESQDYEFDEVDEIYLPKDAIDNLYSNGYVSMCSYQEKTRFYPNQYLVVRDYPSSSTSARVRYDRNKDQLVLIKDRVVWGEYTHRNVEQAYALDALLNDDIPIVVLSGYAGTGKTFLALAAALEKTIDEGRYKQILVARSPIPADRDIGYLKGGKDEKLKSWLQGIIDNASILFGDDPHMFFDYVDRGLIEMEAITYMRGRSLKDKFIIIDEIQNCPPKVIKTIMTRVSEGGKIVLMGDSSQIDNYFLNQRTCGLTYLIEKIKTTDLAAHVHLVDSNTRSEVAAWSAANL